MTAVDKDGVVVALPQSPKARTMLLLLLLMVLRTVIHCLAEFIAMCR